MEIVLNIAWLLLSLILVGFWVTGGVRGGDLVRGRDGRGRARFDAIGHAVPVQVLALAMVVLFLLPVISLSDDLVAAQGLVETDTCLRRALEQHDGQPPMMAATLGVPEDLFAALVMSGVWGAVKSDRRVPMPAEGLGRDFESRPPPSA